MSSKVLYCLMKLLVYQTLIQNVNGGVKQFLDDKLQSRKHTLRNFTDISAGFGYRSEEHIVVTEDGYVLTVFRIPKGKYCHEAVRQPPVLLAHGLLLSSDSWLDSGPGAGLAFLISDSCYDLWAGNVRGNYYSRNHVRLNPDEDIDFWKFSLNEVGVHDLPATIDYILKITGSDKLNYVGFSQSGASFVIMCSEKPGYCDKVSVSILLSPSSRLKNTKSKVFRALTAAYDALEPKLSNARDFEVLANGGNFHKVINKCSHSYFLADTLCRSILNLIDSYHPESITVSTIRALAGHFPAGTSVRTMTWFSQSIKADVFQNFDYGPTENMKRYGKVTSPVYNISATITPVVIIYGKNDHILTPKDAEWLKDQLPNVLEFIPVKDPLWNHFDVIYSQNSRKMLFPKIDEYLFKYSHKGSK